VGGYHLALPRPPKFSPPASLGYLGALVLGELVEDTVGELTLRALITPIVKSTDFGPVLFELPL
jgi:hypothetical protein